MNKKKFPIIFFIISLLVLIGGAAALICRFAMKPATPDANFLISVGEWVEDGSESVIWKFTEAGKGTLTTNGHTNDYDFVWIIDGDKLKIETKWLYDLNNEYTYKIDQGNKVLTLSANGNEYIFHGVDNTEETTE